MTLEIGDVRSSPGTKRRGSIKVMTMIDGGDLTLPIHIVTGTKPGPTLCLTGAIHGDEVQSIATLVELVENTDVNELSGTLLVVPVCNPPALEALSYHTPMDGKSLEEHTFPGDANGSITQRLAYVIGNEIVTKENVDVHIDVHSVPLPFRGMHYNYISSPEGEELSRIQGYEVLFRGPEGGLPGSLVEHSAAQGIPTSHSNGEMRDLLNVMKHLKMIPGEPVLPERQFITKPPRLDFRMSHGGIVFPEFTPEKYPDRIVPAGTLLGRVISPYTFEELERFVAPFEAVVILWVEGQRPFNPGQWVYILGKMDDAEWVRGAPS